ncbi:MAG: hypothetical protein IJF75_05095 [Clostridia bacterium]|nr:hypothetical protein [Clostridia bacterium]
MFEKSKYEKMKKVENEKGYSELTVFVPKGAEKTAVKNLIAKIKECFKNYKLKEGEFLEIHTLSEEYPMEMRLGEIMELIALCKTADSIKFTVNSQEYEI